MGDTIFWHVVVHIGILGTIYLTNHVSGLSLCYVQLSTYTYESKNSRYLIIALKYI